MNEKNPVWSTAISSINQDTETTIYKSQFIQNELTEKMYVQYIVYPIVSLVCTYFEIISIILSYE